MGVFYCFKRNLIALVLCHSTVGLPNLCHFVNESDVKIKHLFREERGIAKHIIIFSHTINSSSEYHEKTGVHFKRNYGAASVGEYNKVIWYN